MRVRPAISSGAGARPSSLPMSQDTRFTFATVSAMCTGMRIVCVLSWIARAIDWRIHQVA